MWSFWLLPGLYVTCKSCRRKRNKLLHGDQSFDPVNCYNTGEFPYLRVTENDEQISFKWRVSLSFFIPNSVRLIMSNMPRVAPGGLPAAEGHKQEDVLNKHMDKVCSCFEGASGGF